MRHLGMVGIGGISQKAYLPYMRQLTGIHWHLFTRKNDVLQTAASLFGTATAHASLEDLLAIDLDGVFIHVATSAHVAMAEQFLKKGIPVYMDKPISEDFQQTTALYQLAAENGTFLMAGFNRRFAPRVAQMKSVAEKKHIVAAKNEPNAPADFQYKLYDLFIPPLDTAMYLMDGQPKCGHFIYQKTGDKLSQVVVTLETETEVVQASMNLQAGTRREVIEVQTPEATYSSVDLSDLSIYRGNQATVENFGSWDTTLYKRGFETIVDSFLQAIETGDNPVSPASSLLSHWICQQINQSEQSFGELDVNLPE